jgi:hypothetical protein
VEKDEGKGGLSELAYLLRADTHKNSIAEQKMVLWCTMRARRENQGVI